MGGAAAQERGVQHPVQRQGRHGAAGGGDGQPGPDAEPGAVHPVGDEGRGDHDPTVGEVDQVGDPKLHGEAHGRDRDHGCADEAEAGGGGVEAHR